MKPLRRIVWRHTDSGRLLVMGWGKASNRVNYSQDDVDWLDRHLGYSGLTFWLEEYREDVEAWIKIA